MNTSNPLWYLVAPPVVAKTYYIVWHVLATSVYTDLVFFLISDLHQQSGECIFCIFFYYSMTRILHILNIFRMFCNESAYFSMLYSTHIKPATNSFDITCRCYFYRASHGVTNCHLKGLPWWAGTLLLHKETSVPQHCLQYVVDFRWAHRKSKAHACWMHNEQDSQKSAPYLPIISGTLSSVNNIFHHSHCLTVKLEVFRIFFLIVQSFPVILYSAHLPFLS